MSKLFLDILNLSIAASWLIAAVMIVRALVMRKAPKWVSCLLWGIVGLRLIIPFSLESPISLVPSVQTFNTDAVYAEVSESVKAPEENTVSDMVTDENLQIGDTSANETPTPDTSVNGQPLPETSYGDIQTDNVGSVKPIDPKPIVPETQKPAPEYVQSGIGAIDDKVNNAINQNASESKGKNPIRAFADVASIVWVIGIAAMAIYAVVNYILLRRRVMPFVPCDDGVRRSESVGSPFILGFIRPRIYLPFGLSDETESHIIAHERAHLKRRDHLIKPIGYAILAVYWFNPLVWVAYVLLCRDIEYACDEKVVQSMDANARKAYASALLECGVKRRTIAACPVAFGEIGVKERVKNALSYKKPMLWIIIAAILVTSVVAVLFITGPQSDNDTSSKITDESSDTVSEEASDNSSESSDAVSQDESQDESQDDKQNVQDKLDAKLIVNGKDISKDYYFEIDSDKKQVMLPIIPILEELGHIVQRKNDTEYLITMFHSTGDIDYVLNTETKTFKTVNYEHDCFKAGDVSYAPENHKPEIRTTNGELLVDGITCLGTIYTDEEYLIIDYKTNTVTIGTDKVLVDAKLLIDGKDVTGNNHVKINLGARSAELPLLFIVNAVGGSYEWRSNNDCVLTVGEESWEIDVEEFRKNVELSMKKGKAFYKLDDEIIIDDSHFHYDFLFYSGILSERIDRVDFNYDNRTINIITAQEDVIYEGKLIVNGKDITEGNHVKINATHYYAELPLVAILKELGAEVNWKNNEVAEVTINNTVYILDIENCSLASEDEPDFNMLLPPPGGSRYSKMLEQELIVDSLTIKCWLFDHELGVTMTINYDDNTININ